MAVVGYATIQLIPSLQGFSGATRSQLAPIIKATGSDSGKQAGGLFGNSFLGSVGRIMSAAGIYEIGSRVASGFSDAITTGIKGFADLQTYTISFKTLLGSASAASDMIKNLYSFAAKTPFDVEGSVVGAQKLLGVGVAAKDIIPTLTTLGDSTAALGGSTADFNSVLLAYSQIMARGKVSTQDLYQISNTGIPIFQLLSKALGMPVGEIQKLIETGKLASDDVLPKLLAQMNKDYGGAMTGQASTLTGLWSTFKDTMSQVLTTALTPVGEWLQSVLPGATAAATQAIQGITAGFTAIGDFFATNKDTFGAAFKPFADILTQTDWAGLLATIAGGLGQVLLGITPIVESLGNALLPIIPPVVDALNSLFAAAPPAGDAVGDAGGKMGEQSQQASDAATNNQTYADSMGAVGDQLTGLKAVLDGFATYVSPVISGMAQVVSAFGDGESAAGVMTDALNGKFGPAAQAVALMATASAAGLTRAFTTMASSVLGFTAKTVTSIGAWTVSVGARINAAMIAGVTRIATGTVQMASAFVSGLASIGARGAAAISTGISQAVGVIGGFVSRFFSSGASLVSGFVSGIVSGISKARDAAAQVVGAVANFFPHSPAPEGPFSGRGWTLYSGRSLVDGFSKGVQQRQGSLRSLMNDTFAAPGMASLKGPTSSVASEVAAATTSRAGTYIGSATVNTTNGNAGVIDDLNFLLRNLNRGGR